MKILVVAGEASSDLHLTYVFRSLKMKVDSLELIGIGGDQLCALGLKPLINARKMAVVGFTEAISKIPQSIRLLRGLENLARAEKPDVAVLADLPDFNLRLAPHLKQLSIPVVYFASPQVWAWRSNRVNNMSKNIDVLMSIFPFEKGWFAENAPEELNVEYIGHPVVEEIPDLAYEPKENQIAIMPGSRKSEWRKLLWPLLGAAVQLKKRNPKLNFVIPLAHTLQNDPEINRLLSDKNRFLDLLADSITISHEPAHSVLRSSKLALVASGTATLETAVVGAPMIVLYKVSWLTATIFRAFVNYSGPIAMVNLILGGLNSKKYIVPELIQSEVTALNVSCLAEEIIHTNKWQQQRDELQKTRKVLSQGLSPLERAAEILYSYS